MSFSNPDSQNMPTELTDQQFLAALPAYSVPVSLKSAEGQRIRATIRRGLGHLVLKELIASLFRGYRGRSREDVKDYYEAGYVSTGERVAAQHGESGRRVSYRFLDSWVVELESRHAEAIASQIMGNIIEDIAPTSLCEVGCGYGRNLLYLANRFENVRCSGVELAQSGVDVAHQLQQLDLVNTGYGRFYGLIDRGMDNVRCTNIVQGSSYKLPLEDASVDMVITCEALEQMQTGCDQALREIRRVAGRYALFYEPFADGNDWLQRLYLWSRNYFRMPAEQLRDYGFEPIGLFTHVPVKPTFAYTFALCRVV